MKRVFGIKKEGSEIEETNFMRIPLLWSVSFRPTDIDYFTDRRSKFLRLETLECCPSHLKTIERLEIGKETICFRGVKKKILKAYPFIYCRKCSYGAFYYWQYDTRHVGFAKGKTKTSLYWDERVHPLLL